MSHAYAESLVMHVAEVEEESRRLRHFTDSRFKIKHDQYEESIARIKEAADKTIAELKARADETDLALKYRLEDFTAQLDTRVTKDYVEILGKQIKSGIIDSFDRKNEDTLDKMHNIVNEIGKSQDQLTIDTKNKLKDYRVEIKKFEQEFYDKVTKTELNRVENKMVESRDAFDT